MAYMNVIKGRSAINILESEIGLVTKTRKIPETLGVVDGAYKTVKAGTVFPANDGTAEGIVFTDTDVTHGDAEGSVIVAGRVLAARVNASELATTALAAKGLYLV